MNKAPDNSTSGNGDANRFLRVEPARGERGEAERGRPVKEPERERTQLAEVLEQSPSFMAILRGPRHVFELVNKRYCQLVGSRDLIGRPVREAFPDIEGQGFFELLDRVYATGEPFVATGMRIMLQRHAAQPPEERFLEFVYQATRDAGGSIAGIFVHGIDLTDHKRAEERLARDAILLANVCDSVVVTDLEGNVTFWNEGATRLFGFEASEMLGRPLAKRLPEPAQSEVTTQIARVIAGGEFTGEWLDYHKDGTRFWIEARVRRATDAAGNVLGVIGVARDISARKDAETELSRAKDAAEAANRAKDDFLATISHELRTPLGGVLLWAKLLKSGTLGEDQRRAALEKVIQCAEDQSHLVNDLLDTTRIVHGKMWVEMRPVDLAEVVHAAVDHLRPNAQAKNIKLEVSASAARVLGDAARLQQVVSNLLTNAIKFTPATGSIEVRLACRGGEARLTVTDNGEGISPDCLAHVFNRFFQADTSITRRHGGLGLGLAIVKSIAELHGGSVHADSEGSGRGATFEVMLPLTSAV